MQRLKPSVGIPVVKRKVSHAWSVVQDTFFSTKEVFEKAPNCIYDRYFHCFCRDCLCKLVSSPWLGLQKLSYVSDIISDTFIRQSLRNALSLSMTEHHHVEEHVSYKAIAATAVVSFLMGYVSVPCFFLIFFFVEHIHS